MKRLTRIMSWAGMPSVIATQYLMPPSAASMIESAAAAAGTNTMLAVCAGRIHRFLDGVEHRQVQVRLSNLSLV